MSALALKTMQELSVRASKFLDDRKSTRMGFHQSTEENLLKVERSLDFMENNSPTTMWR